MKTLLLALLSCAVAAAGETSWQVGLASAKITPEHPIIMSGYGGRLKPFERVAQDIYAKALVLDDGAGHRAVIITSDLASMGRRFAHSTAERIMEKTGFRREQIVLNWAHNHAGPELDFDPARGRGESTEDAQHRVEYTKWLQERLVELVVTASDHREPARLSRGQGVENFVMSRREFTPDGVRLGVNPRGFVDRSVPVLRVDGRDGTLRAVLFGAACHNTTLGAKNYDLCGDYAGFAQHFLEEKFPGVQAMFMIGCAGDANPYPRGDLALAQAHGAELATEVARVLASTLQPVAGPLKVSLAKANLPLQAPTRAELDAIAAKAPKWIIGNARRMQAMLQRGAALPTSYAAPVAVWQFGDDFTWVGLSGEPVADYVLLIEKAIGPLNLWVAGYCNEDFGYLPTAHVVAEGGYETRGLNSGTGWFSDKAQDAIVATVKELAGQVGRR